MAAEPLLAVELFVAEGGGEMDAQVLQPVEQRGHQPAPDALLAMQPLTATSNTMP